MGGTGLMTSPKQRVTQKLRPHPGPGHPGMLCRAQEVEDGPEENTRSWGGVRKKKCQAGILFTLCFLEPAFSEYDYIGLLRTL